MKQISVFPFSKLLLLNMDTTQFIKDTLWTLVEGAMADVWKDTDKKSTTKPRKTKKSKFTAQEIQKFREMVRKLDGSGYSDQAKYFSSAIAGLFSAPELIEGLTFDGDYSDEKEMSGWELFQVLIPKYNKSSHGHPIDTPALLLHKNGNILRNDGKLNFKFYAQDEPRYATRKEAQEYIQNLSPKQIFNLLKTNHSSVLRANLLANDE